ncbi:hypothetical protein SRHO_G00124280 [Serrasalmus rhombeus]
MPRRSLRGDLHGYLHDRLLPSLNPNQKRQLRKTKQLKTRKRTKRARQRPRSPQRQRPMRRTTQKMEKPRPMRSRTLLKKPRRKQNPSSTTASHQSLSSCPLLPSSLFSFALKTLPVSCYCPSLPGILLTEEYFYQ